MASTKISDMTAATDLTGAVIPIVQGGVNKKADASLFSLPIETGTADEFETVVQNNYEATGYATPNFTINSTIYSPLVADTSVQCGFINVEGTAQIYSNSDETFSGSQISASFNNATFFFYDAALDKNYNLVFAASGATVTIADDAGTTGEYLGSDGSGKVVWGTPSDIKLKENIVSIPESLEKINQLNPVTFDLKESGEHSRGFIAQEVEQVFPEMVTDKNGTKHLKNYFLEPYLVKAIQELTAKVEELSKEIELLKNCKP